MVEVRGEMIGVLSSKTNINIDEVRSDTDSESSKVESWTRAYLTSPLDPAFRLPTFCLSPSSKTTYFKKTPQSTIMTICPSKNPWVNVHVDLEIYW
jgi:hypothetical protein